MGDFKRCNRFIFTAHGVCPIPGPECCRAHESRAVEFSQPRQARLQTRSTRRTVRHLPACLPRREAGQRQTSCWVCRPSRGAPDRPVGFEVALFPVTNPRKSRVAAVMECPVVRRWRDVSAEPPEKRDRWGAARHFVGSRGPCAASERQPIPVKHANHRQRSQRGSVRDHAITAELKRKSA